ncbi:MAG: hypothetical protein WC470_01825 [Candidatus Paceibacterota bacterium]
MNKNIKYLFSSVAVILFCLCQTVLAVEIKYPEIFGQKITDQTTTAGFTVYFFTLAIALGAVVVFCVMVSAGLDFVMAGGEPTKISGAKKKIMGAFIGLILLYSSYLLLKTINPELLNPKVSTMSCEELLENEGTKNVPVCVDHVKIVEEKETRYSEMTLESSNNLILEENEKVVIFKYDNVKEIWVFPSPYYKGKATKIYDYKKSIFPIEITSTEEKPIKSFKIIMHQEGFYFYDGAGFTVEDGTGPIFSASPISDFSNVNFDNKTKSIDVVAPRYEKEQIMPMGILFPEPKYRGICAVAESGVISDLKDKETYIYDDEAPKFGYGSLSSVIIFTTKINNSTTVDKSMGTVIFYNTKNCGQNTGQQDELDEETQEIPANCEVQIAPTFAALEKLISASCPKLSTIRSFRINGDSGGVVIRNANQRCQYWNLNDVAGSGNCLANIETSDIFNPAFGGVKPISFMVFPVTK